MNTKLDTTKGWEAPFLRGMIAIDDGDEIREVLSGAHFAPMGAEGRPFYYDNVIATLDGPEHLHRRRIANRVFLEGPLKDYMDSVYAPVLDLCLAELSGQRGPDGLIHADLMPLGWRVLVRFSLRILGLDGDEDQAQLDEVVTIIQLLSEALVSEWSTNRGAGARRPQSGGGVPRARLLTLRRAPPSRYCPRSGRHIAALGIAHGPHHHAAARRDAGLDQ